MFEAGKSQQSTETLLRGLRRRTLHLELNKRALLHNLQPFVWKCHEVAKKVDGEGEGIIELQQKCSLLRHRIKVIMDSLVSLL